jgi:hypothetical protein
MISRCLGNLLTDGGEVVSPKRLSKSRTSCKFSHVQLIVNMHLSQMNACDPQSR